MAVKTSNQHQIGPFQAQTGQGSALRLCMSKQIQLKTVKTVEIEPDSAVLWRMSGYCKKTSAGKSARSTSRKLLQAVGIVAWFWSLWLVARRICRSVVESGTSSKSRSPGSGWSSITALSPGAVSETGPCPEDEKLP